MQQANNISILSLHQQFLWNRSLMTDSRWQTNNKKNGGTDLNCYKTLLIVLLDYVYYFFMNYLELVSKELNHLAAILHVYAGGLIFMK